MHYLDKKYLSLPEHDRRYIDAAREDGIHWRGEDIDFFHKLVEKTMLWRDMSEEEKATLKAEAIRKAHNFVRPAMPRPEKPSGQTVHFDAEERSRQLDAAYRAMTREERAAYDAAGEA
jgi:hypothetical protein